MSMYEHSKRLRLVVASPADVNAERAIVTKVVDELNKGIAADRGLEVCVIRWETDTYPGFHAEGPQGLIDTILHIEDCDVVIGIFWKRFGTLTKEGTTGTEHEIRRAYEAWEKHKRPQLMVYFNQKPSTPQSEEEARQWGQVLRFRKEFPKEGLWWSYKGTIQFERILRAHLTSLIRDKFPITTTAFEKEPEGGLGVATEAGTWAPTGLDHIRIIAWPDVNELATTISVHMKERNIPEAVDADVILAKRLNSGTWDRAAVARGLMKILSALFVIAKRPHVGFDRRFSSGPYPKFPEAEIKFGLDQPYDQLEKRDDRVRYFWIEVHQDHFLVSFLDDEQCWGFRDDKDEPQLWKLSDIAVDFQRLSRGAMDVAVQFGMKVVGKAGKPWYGPEGEIQISLELSALVDDSQSNRN